MKILVPVKRVVDYNVKVRVKSDGTGQRGGLKTQRGIVDVERRGFGSVAVGFALQVEQIASINSRTNVAERRFADDFRRQLIVESKFSEHDIACVVEHFFRHNVVFVRGNYVPVVLSSYLFGIGLACACPSTVSVFLCYNTIGDIRAIAPRKGLFDGSEHQFFAQTL